MYHQTKPFFPYWLETALGVEGDQDSTDTYFETIDSNGDGNLQVWEFFGIPNVQLSRFKCPWKCISAGLTLGQSIGGWLSNNVYNWGYWLIQMALTWLDLIMD